MTSTVSILPGDATLQIPFAFLITSFSLLLSMRVSPFIDPELQKFHVLSLLTQCVTLFAGILVEIQSMSDAAGAGSGDKNSMGQVIVEFLLVSFNISILVVPIYLSLQSSGYFSKASLCISMYLTRSCKHLGVKARRKNFFWPRSDLLRVSSAGLHVCSHTHFLTASACVFVCSLVSTHVFFHVCMWCTHTHVHIRDAAWMEKYIRLLTLCTPAFRCQRATQVKASHV